MNRLLLFLLTLTFTANALAGDWPFWRGPDRNGIADPNQDPPVEFGPSKNLKWSADLPGRSHGSPIVAAGKVLLTSADEEKQVQSLHCFDRETGKALWTTEIHRGGFNQKLNKKGTWASTTPACDGQRVFVNFLNGKSVYTTALDLDGKKLWQTKISNYTVHQAYGASPAIWEGLVLVAADNKGGGALCALDRQSGETVWKVERAALPNYPSPIVLEAAGKNQLFMSGVEKVSSFDPLTGKTNWEIEGATTECVTTTVTDGERIFTSGGYPRNHVAAIAADGSGKIVWNISTRVYVPSMLVTGGHLYAVMDNGVAACWQSDNGEEKWKVRLGGNVSASPTLVGDRVYAINEEGLLYVFTISPAGHELLAKNKIGDQGFASPVICDGEIFLRTASTKGGKRQETLSCFSR